MTEGNVIDYDWILHDIEEMAQKFAIRRVFELTRERVRQVVQETVMRGEGQ